ncbi:MAG: rod shape-determining protein MreD [Candidatus Omnitrophota bacterium]|mgnify:CR=1 FL=1
MRPRLVILLFFFSVIFQVTLADYFKIFGVKPDLLLVALFIGGLFLELKWALVAGFILGAIKDAFLLNTLSLNTVLFPLWIIFYYKVSRRVSIEDNLSRSLLLGAIALLNNLISGLFLIFLGSAAPLGIFLKILFLSSLYTLLVCYLFLRVISKWIG